MVRNNQEKTIIYQYEDHIPNIQNVKISIIVPVYNIEKYIGQCIESVLDQTLQNIEVICVNDGSTDTSGKILEIYAKKDSRVKIINKENKGLSAARNDGIASAIGRYVLFLDGDDYLAGNTLELLYNEACQNKLDLIAYGAEAFGDYENVQTEEEYLLVQRRTEITNKWLCRDKIREGMVITGQEFLSEMSRNEQYVSMACQYLINRKFYASKALNFPVGIIHEDEYFSLTTLLQVKKMKFINLPLYKYRIRSGSIMTNLDRFKSVNSIFFICTECHKFLTSYTLDEIYSHDVLKLLKNLGEVAALRYTKLSKEEKTRLLDGLNCSEIGQFWQVLGLKEEI